MKFICYFDSSLKNFSFSEPGCGVIQMSVNSILFFKVVRICLPCFLIVRVSMHLVWPRKVSDLSDALFPIVNSNIQKPWFRVVRILVVSSRYNIVSYR